MSGCESLLTILPATRCRDRPSGRPEDHARQAAYRAACGKMKADWCFGLEFTFDMCSDLADGTAPGPIFPWAATHLHPTALSTEPLAISVRTGASFQHGDTECSRYADKSAYNRPCYREAKFLRAMAYFRMLNCWAECLYYDETCDINEQFSNLNAPRSSADEIRGHVIA